MVFEIADLYATLAVRFNKSPNDAEFFKELFNPRAALASLSSRLEQIPGVGQILSGVATEVYTELLNIVVESVCFRAKVTTEGVFVRSKSLID